MGTVGALSRSIGVNQKILRRYTVARGKDEQKLRSRLLTLPVMMAVVASIVDCQINSLREVMRVLSEDGLLWVSPMKVSPKALSQRLRTLPVELFQQVFEPVMQRMRLKSHAKLPISKQWQAFKGDRRQETAILE